MLRPTSKPHIRTSNWTDQYALHLVKKIPQFTIDYSDPEESHKIVTLKRLEATGYLQETGDIDGVKVLGLTDTGTTAYQQLRTQGKAYIDELIYNPVFSLTSKGRVPSRYCHFWEWLEDTTPENYPAVKSLGDWLAISNITFLTIFTEMNASTVVAELEEFYDTHKYKCDALLARVSAVRMKELHDYFLQVEHENYNFMQSLSPEFVKARYVLQVGREAEAIWKSYARWNDHAKPIVSGWLI